MSWTTEENLAPGSPSPSRQTNFSQVGYAEQDWSVDTYPCLKAQFDFGASGVAVGATATAYLRKLTDVNFIRAKAVLQPNNTVNLVVEQTINDVNTVLLEKPAVPLPSSKLLTIMMELECREVLKTWFMDGSGGALLAYVSKPITWNTSITARVEIGPAGTMGPALVHATLKEGDLGCPVPFEEEYLSCTDTPTTIQHFTASHLPEAYPRIIYGSTYTGPRNWDRGNTGVNPPYQRPARWWHEIIQVGQTFGEESVFFPDLELRGDLTLENNHFSDAWCLGIVDLRGHPSGHNNSDSDPVSARWSNVLLSGVRERSGDSIYFTGLSVRVDFKKSAISIGWTERAGITMAGAKRAIRDAAPRSHDYIHPGKYTPSFLDWVQLSNLDQWDAGVSLSISMNLDNLLTVRVFGLQQTAITAQLAEFSVSIPTVLNGGHLDTGDMGPDWGVFSYMEGVNLSLLDDANNSRIILNQITADIIEEPALDELQLIMDLGKEDTTVYAWNDELPGNWYTDTGLSLLTPAADGDSAFVMTFEKTIQTTEPPAPAALAGRPVIGVPQYWFGNLQAVHPQFRDHVDYNIGGKPVVRFPGSNSYYHLGTIDNDPTDNSVAYDVYVPGDFLAPPEEVQVFAFLMRFNEDTNSGSTRFFKTDGSFFLIEFERHSSLGMRLRYNGTTIATFPDPAAGDVLYGAVVLDGTTAHVWANSTTPTTTGVTRNTETEFIDPTSSGVFGGVGGSQVRDTSWQALYIGRRPGEQAAGTLVEIQALMDEFASRVVDTVFPEPPPPVLPSEPTQDVHDLYALARGVIDLGYTPSNTIVYSDAEGTTVAGDGDFVRSVRSDKLPSDWDRIAQENGSTREELRLSTEGENTIADIPVIYHPGVGNAAADLMGRLADGSPAGGTTPMFDGGVWNGQNIWMVTAFRFNWGGFSGSPRSHVGQSEAGLGIGSDGNQLLFRFNMGSAQGSILFSTNMPSSGSIQVVMGAYYDASTETRYLWPFVRSPLVASFPPGDGSSSFDLTLTRILGSSQFHSTADHQAVWWGNSGSLEQVQALVTYLSDRMGIPLE
jgi:hypothetical protein